MTGGDFLELAGRLLASARKPSPALCRTAISRAYYGAFHLAREFLADIQLAATRDHGDVWKCLGGCGQLDAQRTSALLRTLHENRVAADYRLEAPQPNDVEFARSNVERAMDVMSLLAQCAQEPARSTIKVGINAYRQKISGAT